MSAMAPALRLGAATLGASVGPREQEIDARWLMAYAASLGETSPRYFDTGTPAGPLAHPLFSVCYVHFDAVDTAGHSMLGRGVLRR